MPHPLSIQRAAMIDDADTPYQPSSDRPRPYPRRIGRVRHSSDSLLLKICTNAVQRRARDATTPPPTIPSRAPSPSVATRSTTPDLCISPSPPVFTHLGHTQAVLPLEVINMILTRYLEHDIPTLKSFSLSCRYFCHKARPFIFHRVHLYMHPTLYKHRGADLSELFTTSRHLLPHIKHAMIFNLFPEDSCGSSRREDKEALRVLMNLTSVTKLSIHGYNNKPWGAVPRDVQLAIKTSLRGKRITGVEVVAMSEFPVYLLEGCRSLKELTLSASPTCYPLTDRDGIAKKTMTFAVGQHNPTPIYLEKLSLTMPTSQLAELTEWMLSDQCSLDVSRVRSMHIRHRSQYSFKAHQLAVSSLLSQCPATLEELEIDAYTPSHTVDITSPCPDTTTDKSDLPADYKPECNPASPHTVEDIYKLVDIGQLRSLRRISLSFGIPDLYDQRRHISLLSQMFRNIGKATASKLEEIGIFLWITKPCRNQPSQELRRRLCESGSWDTLDRVLSMIDTDGVSAGPAAAGVVQRVHPDDQEADANAPGRLSTSSSGALKSLKIQLTKIRSQEEAANLMAICLPRLTRQGIVNVQDKLEWIGD